MAIEYKTVTYRTVESANDNATYCWVELSAAHVPAVNGLIKRIVIQGANDLASDMTTDPMYLGIWERQDDGGLISLGCSKNAIVQAINQQSVWDFDGAIIRGKSLLLGLLSSPTEHWTNNTALLLRSRVQTNDTDGCVILTNIGRIRVTPDITFTVDVPEYVPDDEPEPEPETDDTERVIDISKYWIPLIRETAEFQQIAAAVNPELNRLLQCKKEVEKSCFLETLFSVQKWENIYNLTVTDDMTFEDRKSQVLNRLNQNVPYTSRVVRRMIAAIVGEGNFNENVDNDKQTFNMSLTADAISKQADVDQLLKRVLPENLVIKYDDMPMDYTRLEYLESSGTQYIDTGIVTDGTYTIGVKFKPKGTSFNWVCGRHNSWNDSSQKGDSLIYYYEPQGYIYVYQGARNSLQQKLGYDTYDILWKEGSIAITVNGERFSMAGGTSSIDVSNPTEKTYYLFKYNGTFITNPTPIRIYAFSVWNGVGEKVIDLVPVLTDTGSPCMYDKVSRTCFFNRGTGSFGYRKIGSESAVMPLDLDDPYYTAPSGVWAKPIDEYTLDIITALDPTVDASQGYKLFANTGEAYKYFNIKEVIENE